MAGAKKKITTATADEIITKMPLYADREQFVERLEQIQSELMAEAAFRPAADFLQPAIQSLKKIKIKKP